MLTGDVPGGITGFQQLVRFGSLHISGIAYRVILAMMLGAPQEA